MGIRLAAVLASGSLPRDFGDGQAFFATARRQPERFQSAGCPHSAPCPHHGHHQQPALAPVQPGLTLSIGQKAVGPDLYEAPRQASCTKRCKNSRASSVRSFVRELSLTSYRSRWPNDDTARGRFRDQVRQADVRKPFRLFEMLDAPSSREFCPTRTAGFDQSAARTEVHAERNETVRLWLDWSLQQVQQVPV